MNEMKAASGGDSWWTSWTMSVLLVALVASGCGISHARIQAMREHSDPETNRRDLDALLRFLEQDPRDPALFGHAIETAGELAAAPGVAVIEADGTDQTDLLAQRLVEIIDQSSWEHSDDWTGRGVDPRLATTRLTALALYELGQVDPSAAIEHALAVLERGVDGELGMVASALLVDQRSLIRSRSRLRTRILVVALRRLEGPSSGITDAMAANLEHLVHALATIDIITDAFTDTVDPALRVVLLQTADRRWRQLLSQGELPDPEVVERHAARVLQLALAQESPADLRDQARLLLLQHLPGTWIAQLFANAADDPVARFDLISHHDLLSGLQASAGIDAPVITVQYRTVVHPGPQAAAYRSRLQALIRRDLQRDMTDYNARAAIRIMDILTERESELVSDWLVERLERPPPRSATVVGAMLAAGEQLLSTDGSVDARLAEALSGFLVASIEHDQAEHVQRVAIGILLRAGDAVLDAAALRAATGAALAAAIDSGSSTAAITAAHHHFALVHQQRSAGRTADVEGVFAPAAGLFAVADWDRLDVVITTAERIDPVRTLRLVAAGARALAAAGNDSPAQLRWLAHLAARLERDEAPTLRREVCNHFLDRIAVADDDLSLAAVDGALALAHDTSESAARLRDRLSERWPQVEAALAAASAAEQEAVP